MWISFFPPKKTSKRTQGTAVTCSSRISRSKEVLDPATGFLAPGYTIADRFVENSGLPTYFVSRGHKRTTSTSTSTVSSIYLLPAPFVHFIFFDKIKAFMLLNQHPIKAAHETAHDSDSQNASTDSICCGNSVGNHLDIPLPSRASTRIARRCCSCAISQRTWHSVNHGRLNYFESTHLLSRCEGDIMLATICLK